MLALKDPGRQGAVACQEALEVAGPGPTDESPEVQPHAGGRAGDRTRGERPCAYLPTAAYRGDKG